MVYSVWLAGLSLLFVAWERLLPRRRQPLFRRNWWSDLVYVVFNSEYLGVLIGMASLGVIARLDRTLDLAGLKKYAYLGFMKDQPLWLQFLVFLLAYDFLQWLVHNLLHRVPWLWEFHKVHHSIVEMDWIGDWRFHWFEIVVYRSLLYVPAAFFGMSGAAMFWVGIVNTFVGHFAHANVAVNVGWLKYLVNSPEMHLWHHNHPDEGPVNRNFGLTLACWDWIFGTAYVPVKHDPAKLGFTGIETYPQNVVTQFLKPLRGLVDLARGR